MNINVGRKAIAEATEKLKNWGRWGKDDQIGTLNHITPEDIVRAAGLIRTGKVFALGIPLDRHGPQTGLFGGRWNPIHTMLATGTDAVAGRQDKVPSIRYADDAINMPVQCATHWDSLGHIFYEDKMYNGFDAREVDCNGLGKLGIEHTKNKMVGRGVLLDIARFRGVDLAQGRRSDLQRRARQMRQGRRTSRSGAVISSSCAPARWSGAWRRRIGAPMPAAMRPGVRFENCYWCQDKEIAAICSDTWGVEVRPNETKEVNQPWHWVVIPAMGLTMGEMFYVKELAEDCEADGIYEFFFCGVAAHHHRRHRLAAQSASDQITTLSSLRCGGGSGASALRERLRAT